MLFYVIGNNCSQKAYILGLDKSTASRTSALHMADSGLIPGTTYCSPSPTSSDIPKYRGRSKPWAPLGVVQKQSKINIFNRMGNY